MTRYVSQRDTFRCGPIAILNALLWAGQPVSYKRDIDRITKGCDCTLVKRKKSDSGTYLGPFEKALRKEGKGIFKVFCVKQPRLYEIVNHLQDGGSIVVDFEHTGKGRSGDRHYASFVDVSISGKILGSVNLFKTKAYYKTHTTTFTKMRTRKDHWYRAWFLTKVKKHDTI